MATIDDAAVGQGGDDSFDSIPNPEYETIKPRMQEHVRQNQIGSDVQQHLDKDYEKKRKAFNSDYVEISNDVPADDGDDADGEGAEDVVNAGCDDLDDAEVLLVNNIMAASGKSNNKHQTYAKAAKSENSHATVSENNFKKFFKIAPTSQHAMLNNSYEDEDTEMAATTADLNGYTLVSNAMHERTLPMKSSSMHKAKKKNKSSKKESRDKGISGKNVIQQNIVASTSAAVSVNVPKMLPVKTKDNKMVMVRLIEGAKPMHHKAFASVKAMAPITTIVAPAPTPAFATASVVQPATATPVGVKISPIKITMLTTPETPAEAPPPPPPPQQQKQQQEEDQQPQQQQQSHKSISREFIALQRSVKESKVLSDFVTDTSIVKMRKRRKSSALRKAAAHSSGDGETNLLSNTNGIDDSSSDNIQNIIVRRRTTVEKDHLTNATAPSNDRPYNSNVNGEKRRKYISLKDDVTFMAKPRSRSKSATEPKLTKWGSDDTIALKRTNMRSQNSDFVQKQREFLQRVRHQQGDADDGSDMDVDYNNDNQSLVGGMEDDDANSSLNGSNSIYGLTTNSLYSQPANDQRSIISVNTSTSVDPDDSVDTDMDSTITSYRNNIEARLVSIWKPAPKPGWDSFCWKCRECGDLIACTKCLRCYHTGCIKTTAAYKLDAATWVCAECAVVDNVLYGPKRVRRHELSLDMLSQLLSFALNRMRNVKGYTKQALHEDDLLNHSKYIVNPVTFGTLQEKIEKRVFRCAEEFVNETKWIQHNALILTYGTPNSKEVVLSKTILKICRQEANEIDTCPECYLNANTRSDWFVDVCTQPHLLVWAKLKGFPYWPAKAMGLGQGSHVNVRFFGQHDRAFVPVKDCFLYSEQDPNMQTGKRLARELADCITEVEVHIEKIRTKIGDFKYAPFRMPYDPTEELQQLELMMPGVGEYVRRQQALTPKPSLQYKIVKTADNHLSIIKKPAVASESGNDSDTTHSSTPPIRKKPTEKMDVVEGGDACSSSGVSSGGAVKSKSSSTSKYEVISKVIADESNSSKVSAVILKRKSIGHRNRSISSGSERKRSMDVKNDQPLPKYARLEEGNEVAVSVENATATVIAATAIGKSEENVDGETPKIDKQRNKASVSNKPDARVPLLTIKCATENAVDAAEPEGESIPTNLTPIVLTAVTCADRPSVAMLCENPVEQLVKQKQGVTIKKIPKNSAKNETSSGGGGGITSSDSTSADKMISPASNGSTMEPAPVPMAECSGADADASGDGDGSSNATDMLSSDSYPRNTLKGLVPFIEPKKEIITDEEDNADESDAMAVHPAAAAQMEEQTVNQAAFASEELPLTPLLTHIKQEVLSDEEEQMHCDDSMGMELVAATSTPINSHVGTPTTTSNEKLTGESTVTTTTPPPPPPPQPPQPPQPAQPQSDKDGIRIVGGTTIQRITNKTSTAVIPGTAQVASSSSSSGGNSRRSMSRGIPYGPLPASAMPGGLTVSKAMSTAQQHAAVNTTTTGVHNGSASSSSSYNGTNSRQRARKSFPNRSSMDVGSSALQTASHERSLKATSMVSIPVDVATNRGVPVPPLTAVSKSLPVFAAQPSVAVLTVGSVVMSAQTQQHQPPSQSPSSSSSVSSSATVAAATAFSNGPMNAALLMTAPPPLAGLSQTPPQKVAPSAANCCPSTNSNAPTPNAFISGVDASGDGVGAAPNAAVGGETHLLGDLVTPTLASAITDVICRGPPKILPRPDGPLQSEGSTMFPSQAGPVSRTLVENAHKLTDFFISVMEDTMRELTDSDDAAGLQAKLTLLTMEFERKTQAYEKEIADIKRTSDLMLCEMRKSMDNEKARLVNEVRKQCEQERLRSIEETKKKQWCAHCGREAQFYCCWNTSYCDYPCQQLHWPRHASCCAQTRPATGTSASDVAGNRQSAIASNMQQEQRAHSGGNKLTNASNATTSSTSTPAASTSKGPSSSSSGSRKEKQHQHHNKVNSNVNSNTTAAIVAATHSVQPPPEVLKLPQNTYLRPVTANVGNVGVVIGNNSNSSSHSNGGGGSSSSSNINNNNSNSARNSTTYTHPIQYPVQRFNIPLPITAPMHTNSPYTLVQHGKNWELRPTANSGGSGSSSGSGSGNATSIIGSSSNGASSTAAVVTAANMLTLANTSIGSATAIQQQQQQQHQQQHHHHPQQQHHHQSVHHHHQQQQQQQQTRLASGATITTNVRSSSSHSSGRVRNANAHASANLINANSSGNNSSGNNPSSNNSSGGHNMRPNNQM